MTWDARPAETSPGAPGVVTKKVTIFFAGQQGGPKMELILALPANVPRPVPVFLMPSFGPPRTAIPWTRGYALASFNPVTVEPDRTDARAQGIRAFFSPKGRTEAGPDEWGAIGAWAWAVSRAMDYLETDPDVDAKRVCIMGVSRYGKAVMWAGAQDERFAIVFSCESGCAGATLVRRQFGETVRSITGFAPYWFARNFSAFGDRVNDLPVDWHMLIALMAPRPVYVATAEEDYWGDPRGSFLAAKNAEPVYRLLGQKGLGVEDMPAVDTPVGDAIGYHNRRGGHGLNDYDWQQFLDFADRHLAKGAAE